MPMPRSQPSLRARAVRYLAQREHSRVELRRKLSRYCDQPEVIDALLDDLERGNLLSSERFALSLIHRRQQRYGNLRITQELGVHGLAAAATAEPLQALKDSELARAQAAWARKFQTLPQDTAERAKQARFLSQRGFSSETVRAVLRGDGVEEDG
ncbi:MAG: recombination regulator RecX [Thiomonas sp.]|nr:recombination regulator RecX [Thiomonas sp.]